MPIKKFPLIAHSSVFFSDACLSVYYQYINARGCCFESLKYNRKYLVFTLHYFHYVRKGFLPLYHHKKTKEKVPF